MEVKLPPSCAPFSEWERVFAWLAAHNVDPLTVLEYTADTFRCLLADGADGGSLVLTPSGAEYRHARD